jgi:ABC-2 type transport system permease protein
VIYFGIIGMVLGLLLRSPISAISIGVLWILIIENLLGAVKPVFLKWMPGNQLSTIAQGGSVDISYSHALTLGTSYVLVGAIVATALFSRRDVAN